MQFGRRKLNANGRTVFANEEPESVMIFRMAEAVYAIEDFPADELLWRIEWILGWLQRECSKRPPNRRLPGAASGRRSESAQREIALFSNKENRKNGNWPVALHLNCFGVAAASARLV
jgi:hypothetical protein